MAQEVKKVSWNASEGIIFEISRRRSSANHYFIEGNIKRALSTLISIKQSVIQSLLKEEREELNKIEEKFNKISFALSSSSAISFNQDSRRIYFEAKRIATKIYSDYNDKLMDLLEDRGYLISEQTDASKMKF